jgi:ADP-heptose:LPS heptosyltransferase
MQRPQPRVLVIRGGAIGDFILTLPAIRLIRETIAGCHLEILGYSGIMDLTLRAGLADAVRSLEHGTMAPLFAKGAPIDPALQEYLRSFNLVVSYLYDPDGHFKASLQRVGVKTLLECPHRIQPGAGHAAIQLARPLESLAMYLDDHLLRAPFFDTPATSAAERCRRIVIHPGSGSLAKNWPLDRWRQLAAEITAARPDHRLTVITGDAEFERGVTGQIRQDWSELTFDHWDRLPLVDLAGRLSDASIFVGHDSGISHLAAACGVPCLLLFGPTDPGVWSPPQAQTQVLAAPGGDLTELEAQDVLTALLSSAHLR